MSDAVRVVSASEPPVADIVGYVEALTDSAALGWTWRPGASDRLAVELRHGEQTVARARADGLRDDLARSGIGDGRHAFALPIPDELRSRASELKVVVVDSGSSVVLGLPPAADSSVDRLAPVQRGLDMLIGSQRVLHRNLQAALLQQPSIADALAEIGAAQATLRQSIDTFELFAIRLEQALASHEAPASPAARHRGLAVVAAMAAMALIGSCCALWRAMAI